MRPASRPAGGTVLSCVVDTSAFRKRRGSDLTPRVRCTTALAALRGGLAASGVGHEVVIEAMSGPAALAAPGTTPKTRSGKLRRAHALGLVSCWATPYI